jgi:hypothetical protein
MKRECSSCGRPYRGQGDWNATLKQGVIGGLVCPDCQTPAQNAEAESNAAAALTYDKDKLTRGADRVTDTPEDHT